MQTQDSRREEWGERSLRAEFRAIFAALFFSSLLALVAGFSCSQERQKAMNGGQAAPASEPMDRGER